MISNVVTHGRSFRGVPGKPNAKVEESNNWVDVALPVTNGIRTKFNRSYNIITKKIANPVIQKKGTREHPEGTTTDYEIVNEHSVCDVNEVV